MPDRAIGRHPVGPGKNAGRHVHDARGMGAHIGALVVEVEIVDREDAALAVDRRTNAVELLARMIGGDQMLAPVLDPFHRPAEPHGRDADQHVLRIKLAADAEAAAHVGFVHVDRRGRKPEHAREQLAIAVRHLGGAVQFEDGARGVVAADCAARLQRHAGMAADRQFELDHHGRGAQHRVDVAVALADDRRPRCCGRARTRPARLRRRAASAAPRSRWRRDRPRPRPHRDRRRTPRRPARRRSAPCRSPAPAGGRVRAREFGPRGNRSAARRRCRPRSTPRPRRAGRARPRRRSQRSGRGHGWRARCACEAGAERKCRPAKRPAP